MSPELETLDQLLGGDMPLSVIRQVYPDQCHFVRGMLALLNCGEIDMLDGGTNIPQWKWKTILNGELIGVKVHLTKAGGERMA